MTEPNYPTAGGCYVEENGKRLLVTPSHEPPKAAADAPAQKKPAEAQTTTEPSKPRQRAEKE